MPGLEGTTLGRYYLEQLLGRGGMSEVYLAYDELMKRNVAIKVVSSVHSDYIQRFHREVEAIGTLNHGHILPAFDYGEQGPWHYLVMPYMEQGTLSERLANGPLTLEEAGIILEQIASALQFAHCNGMIHRDIKASNILLGSDGLAYLADFGLVKMLEGDGDIIQASALFGTPEYMAPELAEGPATASSDIYALGVLLYEMVTGRTPFIGKTPIATYWKHIHEEPVPPSRLNPALSRAAEQVILRALEKNPRLRFQSAQALAEAYLRSIETPILYEFEQAPAPHEMPPLPEMPPLHELTPVPETAAEMDSRAPTLLPYVPMQEEKAGNPMLTPVQAGMRKGRSRRYRIFRNPVFIAAAVGIGLLLVAILPLAYIYSQGGVQSQTNATTAKQVAQQIQNAATPVPTPILVDRLSSNSRRRWSENTSTCLFTGGAYHVIVRQINTLQLCGSMSLAVENTAIQVNVSLLSGSDAGFIFRANGQQFYDFEITSRGEFFLRRHDPGKGANYTYLIPNTRSAAIVTSNQKNTLLAIASADDFKLYINGVFAGEQRDSTYTQGRLGFVVGTLAPADQGEGSFTDLELFKA
jgi:serine/threonine protein kinase